MQVFQQLACGGPEGSYFVLSLPLCVQLCPKEIAVNEPDVLQDLGLAGGSVVADVAAGVRPDGRVRGHANDLKLEIVFLCLTDSLTTIHLLFFFVYLIC
jgi:hypothetical protein